MNFSYGNQVVDMSRVFNGLSTGFMNERADVLNRWTPQNTNTDIPRANFARPRRIYSALVEDGSFLRLQTLTLCYQLPSRLLRGAKAGRVYITGQNLLIATNYTGFDPEVNSMRGDNLFNGWPWLSLELASDQVRIDRDEPNLETSGPDFLFYSTGSRGDTVAWRELYNVIFRANLVLANADRVQQWTNPALKPTYVAEAKFLRAYAYLWLTKLYDDVPLLLTLADHDNLAIARTPVEQVHQQIIKDLTEVEAVLPAKWGSSDRGRATRGAAEMALADLYLWRASFLKRSAEWQNASDWAKKVMDSGDWGLSADYISTFLPSNKGNREMIFYVAASGVDSRSSSGWLVNFYFPRDFGLSTGGGWGAGHPTDWHYNQYQPGDYRKEAGYRSGGCRWDGFCVTAFKDGPLPWKYRPTNNGSDGGKCDVDIPLYRFAEAILIYAEAQNELGNSGVAVQYVNMIRARARNGTGAENRASPADYTGPLHQP